MKQELGPIHHEIAGVYRHYKGGIYRVICLARHSETLEEMVVYESLDGGTGCWVRPLRMWNESVLVNGASYPRFTQISGELDLPEQSIQQKGE